MHAVVICVTVAVIAVYVVIILVTVTVICALQSYKLLSLQSSLSAR